ncbi:MAG: hypothetical protein ABL956_11095 [Hyphomonadaceae bacterium]
MDNKSVAPRSDANTPVDGVELLPRRGAHAVVQEEGENLSVRPQPTHNDAYIESDGLMKPASCQAAAGVESANGEVMEAAAPSDRRGRTAYAEMTKEL